MYISIDIVLHNDWWASANIWFTLYGQLNKFLNTSTKTNFKYPVKDYKDNYTI